MAIALDTNVVVDLMRGEPAVRANYDRALRANAPLLISVFVLKELLFGVEVSNKSDQERRKLASLLRELDTIAFEIPDAEVGGHAQAAMRRLGRRAPADDFIVGVHALARGCTLVTANTRHFMNIPGLKLLDWRQPPEELQD